MIKSVKHLLHFVSVLSNNMSRVGLQTSSGSTTAAGASASTCAGASNGDDNDATVMEEINRRNLESRKRKDPSSSQEDLFDSLSHKRCRFT